MEVLKLTGITGFCSTLAVGGFYLIKRGLWYQGKQQGWLVRSLSVMIGITMFLGSIVVAILALSAS